MRLSEFIYYLIFRPQADGEIPSALEAEKSNGEAMDEMRNSTQDESEANKRFITTIKKSSSPFEDLERFIKKGPPT